MRLRLFAAFALLAILAGLGTWVIAGGRSAGDFAVSLDHTRERDQGDFYVGLYPEPSHLNPFTTKEAVALTYVLRFTHDCLMQTDTQTGELEPALAEVIGQSEDGLTIDFKLRDGVRFADGQPVTLDDVRFTYDVLRDRTVVAGSISSSVGGIAKLESQDERRFRVVLRRYHFTGLAGMATGYRVVQKAWFMQQIAARARERNVDVPGGPGEPGFASLLGEIQLPGPGTGPYRIAESRGGAPLWRRRKDLTLVQSPLSWHRDAYPLRWNLAGIRLRFMSADGAIAELKRQQLDWWLPSDPAALLAQHPDLLDHYRQLDYDYAMLGHYSIWWNHRAHPTSDPRVRMALSMLFNRGSIVDDVLGGNAVAAKSWFKDGAKEWPDDLESVEFDSEGARSLLEQAGYGPDKRLRIEILFAIGQSRHRRMIQMAKGVCQEVYVDLDPKPVEAATLTQRLEDREFVGCVRYWSHSGLGVDPYEIFHKDGARNFTGYDNPEANRLLVLAREERDAARRIEYHQAFNRHFRADQPVTMLVHLRNVLLLHKRFRAAEPGWSGMVPQLWWVAEADVLNRFGRPRAP